MADGVVPVVDGRYRLDPGSRAGRRGPQRRGVVTTHGVVTPNMLAPISGFSAPSSGTRAAAAPAIMAAALVMICAEMRLMPAMSTTE